MPTDPKKPPSADLVAVRESAIRDIDQDEGNLSARAEDSSTIEKVSMRSKPSQDPASEKEKDRKNQVKVAMIGGIFAVVAVVVGAVLAAVFGSCGKSPASYKRSDSGGVATA